MTEERFLRPVLGKMVVMSVSDVVQGVVTADGSLQLERRVSLPPGPVRVILEPVPPEREDVWVVLERIHRKRAELGLAGRSRAEIDAEIRALRGEWDPS